MEENFSSQKSLSVTPIFPRFSSTLFWNSAALSLPWPNRDHTWSRKMDKPHF